MPDHLLLGFGPFLIPLPGFLWRREVVKNARRAAAGLAFMSPEHHQVRNFVVRELPRRGEPLSPEFIARHLDLPLGRVTVILIELEQHLTFLFRNEQGSVAWAYPVTTDRTPHQLLYSSGEQGYAA